MSSNIRIQRICQQCGKEFTAQTTSTKYCGYVCAKRAYRARIRNAKIEKSNAETQRIISKPIDEIKAKEFLTVRDVSKLLSCSRQTVYNLINSGNLKAVNIKLKKTLVKRSEIDNLFSDPEPVKPQPEKQAASLPTGQASVQLNESECYNLTEIQTKYGISDGALNKLIKRKNIPKFRKGWYAYVPKTEIDKIFS